MQTEDKKSPKIGLKAIVLITLFALGAVAIVILKTKDGPINQPQQSQLPKGSPAPDFTLPDLNGKMIRLSDYLGNVVLLNIWATWCPPCVEEMPALEKLYGAMKGEAFEILAVSLDESGVQIVAPFMKKHRLSFPALIDSDGKLKKRYRTTGIPETVIIDKQGTIVEKIIGSRDWASPAVIAYFKELSNLK